MDQEDININIYLTLTTWEQKCPGIRVFFNDQKLFETEQLSQQVEINTQITSEPIDHMLVIETFNKTDSMTIVDQATNTIVKDVLVNIEKIMIDNIDVTLLAQLNSTFYPDQTIHKHAPEVATKVMNIGWNGRWELKIESPVYIWLLQCLG